MTEMLNITGKFVAWCVTALLIIGIAEPVWAQDELTWDNGRRYRKEPYKILFLGDTVLSGYGLPDQKKSAVEILKRQFRAGHNIDREVLFLNMSHEGHTTSSAVTHIRQAINLRPDILVFSVGGNDAQKGVDPDIVFNNLNIILKDLGRSGVYTLFVGRQATSARGYTYLSKFNSVYDKVAQLHSAVFMPHLLEGVKGNRMLLQSDNIHPNAQGHQVIADNLDDYLWRMVSQVKRQRKYNDDMERWRKYMIQENEGKIRRGLPPKWTQEQIDNVEMYKRRIQ